MRGRPAKPTVACAGALCALACLAFVAASAAGAGRAADPSARRAAGALLGGVNIAGIDGAPTLAEADRSIAAARQLHAKLVRLAVSWSAMEPVGANRLEPRALSYLDRVLADAAADGIGVIVMLDGTPCWASSAPASLLHRCRPGREAAAGAWPPARPADFAAFCAFLARRYATELTAIEVWNEPDEVNEAYFAGRSKPARYAAVLRAAYAAIKRANPAVKVLGGSLVGSNGAFLRALYAAGIKGYYDGLSVHYYHLTLASLRSIHEVQLANGDGAPLWLDEFGWPSCWPGRRIEQEQACVTAQTQAANIASTFRALSSASYVAAAVLYKLRDSASEEFGLVSARETRKPSFSALSRALASPFGAPAPVTLGLRRRGARVVASGAGPVGDFMQLEAFRGGALRYRALFTLDRFNRYSIALPAALGTHGLRVRVFQYWAGVGRDAQKSI